MRCSLSSRLPAAPWRPGGLLLVLLLLAVAPAQAQRTLWRDAPASAVPRQDGGAPDAARAFDVDQSAVASYLAQVHDGAALEALGAPMPLPLPNGRNAQVRVREASVMAPALQARYPDIRSYVVEGDGVSGRIALSPHGIVGLVGTAQGDVAIGPVTRGQSLHAAQYVADDAALSDALANEYVAGSAAALRQQLGPLPAIGSQLRVYHLAVAVEAELTQAVGGKVSDGVALVNEAVTNLNVVFRRDLAVGFVVVAGNDAVVLTDVATDPFTFEGGGGNLFPPTRTLLNARIGQDNYDLGHVIGTFDEGGGAGTGVACDNTIETTGLETHKADGFSLLRPAQPYFKYHVFLHEVGHQLGAPHTWVTVPNAGGAPSTNPGGVEPGAGFTIMGYGHQDVTRAADAKSSLHFNAESIVLMDQYVRTNHGNTCGTTTATGNDAPVVSVPRASYTIPAGTPFALTGSATDASGTALSYTWDQADQYGDGTGAVPLFRSFAPRPTGLRYFPDPAVDYHDETLPTGSRTYTFRLTARDNVPGAGGVGMGMVSVTTDASVGPLAVTFPQSAGLTYGRAATVTWNVAGTNGGPINATQVDLLFSTDGGATYPYTLASGTANDGSEAVTFPVDTPNGRLKVQASGNIFYAVSPHAFEVTSRALPVLAVTPAALVQTLGNGGTADVSVTVANTAASGASALNWRASLQNVTAMPALPGTCTSNQLLEQTQRSEGPPYLQADGSLRGIGQTFVAPCSGTLSTVGLYLSADAMVGEAWSGTLTLYQGNGTGGAVVGAAAYSVTNGTPGEKVVLALPVPLAVVAGETYTFYLNVTAGRTAVAQASGDVYAGGGAWWGGTPSTAYAVSKDLAFSLGFDARTWVQLQRVSGSVAAGASVGVALTLSAASLPDGTYRADLVIVATNDPSGASKTVPVTLTVASAAISVTPTPLAATATLGGTAQKTLTLRNTAASGAAALEWTAALQNVTGPSAPGSCAMRQTVEQADRSGAPPYLQSALPVGSVRGAGQTFVAPCTGLLSSIGLYFPGGVYVGEAWSGTLTLYQGSGTGGTLLATAGYAGTNGAASTGKMETLRLPTPVSVVAGETYTFYLDVTTGRTAVAQASGNVYAGGGAWLGRSAATAVARTEDLTFSLAFGQNAWATLSSEAGTAAAGASSLVNVTFHAGTLAAGTYTADLVVRSNAPLTPTVTVPVQLTVGGTAAKRLYVDATRAAPGTGTSWATAFPTLTAALAAAQSGDEIWVAAGTYRPTSGTDRTVSFQLVSEVKVYGGFTAGCTDGAATCDDLGDRNWAAQPTILSGDIGVVGDAADNAYHVVFGKGVAPGTVLDGFTITGGNATDPDIHIGSGAGIHLDGREATGIASPTLRNLRIVGNTASRVGGGLFANGSASGVASPSLVNVLFEGNAAWRGGGVYVGSANGTSAPTFVNVTFTGNSATQGPAAFVDGYQTANARPVFANTIVWGNTGATGADAVLNNLNAVTTWRRSVVQGSGGSGAWTARFGTDGGGNLDADPRFVDAAQRDWRLQATSPAIDAGDARADLDGPGPDTTTVASMGRDLGGNARHRAGRLSATEARVDIGAYEFQGAAGVRYYVNASATGTGDGRSWANAFRGFQAGIDAAKEGDEVWVAGGTYVPDGAFRSATFLVAGKNGVRFYGGFAGTEATLGARDLSAGHTTILSGDRGVVGDSTDNALTVVTFNGTAAAGRIAPSTVFDGFTITRGNGQEGSALYCNAQGAGAECSPTFGHLVLTRNAGTPVRIYSTEGGVASPFFVNATIADNYSASGAAALVARTNQGTASPTFVNSVFQRNRSGGTVSMAYLHADGGAASPTFVNVTFAGNSQAASGGYLVTRVEQLGGAVRPRFHNVIAWGNGTSLLNPQATITNVEVRNALLEGGCPAATTCAGTLRSDDPAFATVDGVALRLSATSPALDVGEASLLPRDVLDLDRDGDEAEALPFDRSGRTRVQGGAVDLGAYEAPAASYVIAGRVRTSAGGVAEATVQAVGAGGAVLHTVTSDASGAFTLPALLSGTAVTVRVSKVGVSFAPGQVQFTSLQQPTQLVFWATEAAQRPAVEVTAQTNVPATGATQTPLAGGGQLSFPAGAVSQALAVQIGRFATPPPGAPVYGELLFFGPVGTTFAQPVTVSLPCPSPLPSGQTLADLRIVRFDEVAGTYRSLPTTLNQANGGCLLVASTTQFSGYGVSNNTVTSVASEAALGASEAFRLSSVYPNPLATQARFTLAVRTPQDVTIGVFDLLGRRVAVLHDGRMEAGVVKAFTFDAGSLPSGSYLLRATGDGWTQHRRLVVVR